MKLLTPTIYVHSVTDIDYKQLKDNGIKLLCFDLDNTLDKPDRITEEIHETMLQLLNEIKNDFDILIVSNNTLVGRVASFADKVNLEFIEKMKKPFQKNYKNSEIINSYPKDQIIFIGDKITTDVIGANRFGSPSVLVDPLYPGSKKWYAFIMHGLDKLVFLLGHTKRGQYFNHLGSENE